MISHAFKPAVVRVITPIARFFLRIGLTPNLVTIIGAAGVVATALLAYPSGHLFGGTLLICFFALSDLFDGTMARISEKGTSKWGGFLDSTLDRVTDFAISLGLLVYLAQSKDQIAYVLAISMVSGFLVSYIRARAESLTIECSGGFAERTERLIFLLTAIGFSGLGIPYILSFGIWILAIASSYTVIERLLIVKRATNS